MLAVVEHQQQVPVSEMPDQRIFDRPVAFFAHAERGRDAKRHALRLADRSEIDVAHAIGKGRQHRFRELYRQSRLAAASDPGQRQESGLPEELRVLGEIVLAADEARQLLREAVGRRVERAQRRKGARQIGVKQLPHIFGGREVAQSHTTKVQNVGAGGEAISRKNDDDLGQQHLAAVRSTHDARGTVDCAAEVVAVALFSDASVQAAPHLQRDTAVDADGAHPALQVDCGHHCAGGIVEHGVQPIANHLHQSAATTLDDRAAESVVARESLSHTHRLGLPELAAALDVGKEKCDGAAAATGVHGNPQAKMILSLWSLTANAGSIYNDSRAHVGIDARSPATGNISV